MIYKDIAASRTLIGRLLGGLHLLPPSEPLPLPRRLGVGLLCGAGALLLRLPLEGLLAGGAPFVFFVPAVMIAAVVGGVAAAASAAVVAILNLLVWTPVSPGRAALLCLLFVVSCGLVTAVAEELRGAIQRLSRLEADHRLERASLEAVFKSAPVGLSLSEAPSGRSILINDEMKRILGREIGGAAMERYLLMNAVHPDGRPYDLADYPPVRSIRNGEEIRAEPLVVVRPDGSRERAEISSTPLRRSDGTVQASVTVLVDVEAREQAIEHQKLITDELAHRMKNTLTVVQAIVAQSLRATDSVSEARGEITQRLAALGRAQDALTRASWRSATLRDTVFAALEPLALGPDRLTIEGPEIRIGSRAALSFTLALHELATNAVKYGALSLATGHVDVHWRVDSAPDGDRLSFTWNETGGPEVRPPHRQGFGSRLIESVSKAFAGQTTMNFDVKGLCWKVTARVNSLQAF